MHTKENLAQYFRIFWIELLSDRQRQSIGTSVAFILCAQGRSADIFRVLRSSVEIYAPERIDVIGAIMNTCKLAEEGVRIRSILF